MAAVPYHMNPTKQFFEDSDLFDIPTDVLQDTEHGGNIHIVPSTAWLWHDLLNCVHVTKPTTEMHDWQISFTTWHWHDLQRCIHATNLTGEMKFRTENLFIYKLALA